MNKCCFVFITVFVTISSIGCGTLNNTVSGTPPGDGRPFEPPNVVYGGVRTSVRDGWNGLTQPQTMLEPVAAIFLLAVDTPLSVVGDTLTLPITIPASIDRGINAYYFPKEPSKTEARKLNPND